MDEDEKGRLGPKPLWNKLSLSTKEWLQALTTLVAILGFGWGLVTYFFQTRDARIAKEVEDLNHTLTQMGGERPYERAAGVSQLGFLMNDDGIAPIIRDRALVATVNALSVEGDAVVRDLLIERIDHLRVELFPRSVIEGVERQLLSRNRQLAQYLTDEELYNFIVWRLNTNAYPHEPSAEALELESTGQALALLIGSAAETAGKAAAKDADKDMTDLSGLVCINCSFRCECVSPLRLKFSGTIFVNTQFTGLGRPLDLGGSDFSTSSHYNTVFQNVNVEKVSFKGGYSKMERQIIERSVDAGNDQFPEMIFSRTKLDGADFEGRLLFGILSSSHSLTHRDAAQSVLSSAIVVTSDSSARDADFTQTRAYFADMSPTSTNGVRQMVASLLSTTGRSEKLMLKGKSSTFVVGDLSNGDSGLSQNSHIRPTDENDIRNALCGISLIQNNAKSKLPRSVLRIIGSSAGGVTRCMLEKQDNARAKAHNSQ